MTSLKSDQQVGTEVRILAKLWEEDGIWNISAFDLPIVAFGSTMTEAQCNFEDAVSTHFDALQHINKLPNTLSALHELALQDDFYESRITPHVTVQNFQFSSANSAGLHSVGAQ